MVRYYPVSEARLHDVRALSGAPELLTLLDRDGLDGVSWFFPRLRTSLPDVVDYVHTLYNPTEDRVTGLSGRGAVFRGTVGLETVQFRQCCECYLELAAIGGLTATDA